jgi:hypothetical protein
MAHIRDIALSSFNLSRGREVHLDNSKPSTSRRLVGSLEKLTPSRNKRLVADEPGPSSPKRMRAGSPGDDDVIIMEGPPEGNAPKAMPDRGKSVGTMTNWARMKTGENEKALDPRKVLRSFRVDPKRLGSVLTNFQSLGSPSHNKVEKRTSIRCCGFQWKTH